MESLVLKDGRVIPSNGVEFFFIAYSMTNDFYGFLCTKLQVVEIIFFGNRIRLNEVMSAVGMNYERFWYF